MYFCMDKKLISFVIPAYSEEKNIALLYKELILNFEKISDTYKYEIIFVNDGSPDNSWEEINKLCKKNKNVVGINLSRNFGHQGALTAGYTKAKGESIISMDCDGQDPVFVAFQMIKKWEKGYEVIYARRKKRNDNFLKKYTAIAYYKLLSFISETEIPRNVGDFRLIDKKVLKEFLKLDEKDRYIRGMFAWIGFKTAFIDFERPERVHGETAYTWRKMIRLAMDGILNFSMFPLRIGFIFGIIMILFSLGFHFYMIYDSVINDVFYPLYKWLIVTIFGIMGLQFMFMWIMGEYIGRIYNETRGRPNFIISDIKNEK
ncbi:glycosyltransferase [Candidatus Gracilibacteria bacterium]|nr:MAG: glycosyltransferase [Candidatus Gracilibacteria bacterium]